MKHMLPKLLLASSSPYRAAMLRQLGLSFESFSPDINENPLANELPEHLAQRLSQQKAAVAQSHYPEHIIIASDQVACIEGSKTPIGKPHTFENANAQLQQYSGKTLEFYTGLSVFLPENFAIERQTTQYHSVVEHFKVRFRTLGNQQIQRYLEIEEPLDCAGSFKAEGLGITLFEGFEGRDYNTLIGLPLMALVDVFLSVDIDVLELQTK
jgi:MAF protein